MNTKRKPSKIKASYVFYTLAVGVLLISAILYLNFQSTKDKIFVVSSQANLRYVKSLADNLAKDIIRATQKDLVSSIQEDEIIKEYIESDLKLFVTTKYQYIYLIHKDTNDSFSILADSTNSIDEKNRLLNIHQRADVKELQYIYKNKKHLYVKHTNDDNIGATYLQPIIINDVVQAVIAVEFSLEEQNTISFELKTLGDMFILAILFFVLVFALIVWFSVIDNKREKEKESIFQKLKESNRNLELETNKVHELNNNLENRVAQEVEKNRIQDQHMLQQSRLAQMGEMISMIAHQWRQPLNAISTTSIAIGLNADLDNLDKKTTKELSKKISNYVQHLSSTIDDFRNFFKPNKIKTEANYDELIASVLNIVEDSIKDSDIRTIREQKCEETFFTYPNEIKQVILNLVKNAEDVLRDNEIKDPYIKIKTYTENDNFILEVSDNGGGISEEILPNIFDPYFSTKTKKDGTGLGLYMSKTIIEEHCGGSLIVSNDDNGAVFRILLGKNDE